MSEISRVALFGKLNPLAYQAIESATVFCRMRGNPHVELVHWIVQLVQGAGSDLQAILRHFQVDEAVLSRDLTAALDRLPRGATAVSDFSGLVEQAIERAWVHATLQFGDSHVRTGALVLGLLRTPALRDALLGLSRQFGKLQADALAEHFQRICGGTAEATLGAQDGGAVGAARPRAGAAGDAVAPAAMGRGEALARFCVDLTARAREGGLDPVTGRDEEIRRIVDVLMRRRQNNPLLTGEAGVGKTAVVEGLAQRLARGDVPPQLKDVSLLGLDLGLLQAGASMKGEFEQRLRQVIDEVQASPRPIILFIDEVHALVGAGGAAGTGDAANLLKPALARGDLRTIGATTWAEYKKYIEKDPALTRRFQVVQIAEPDEAGAVLMLRGVASALERHHRVQLLDEAIEAAVRLGHRYIPARQLPDKAVSLLDTACARVAVSQHATPAEVEDCLRRIEALETEAGIVEREAAVGVRVGERGREVAAGLVRERERRDVLAARWRREQALVARVLALRAALREAAGRVEDTVAVAVDAAAPGRDALLAELHAEQDALAALQGESPLVMPAVDAQAVAGVVADWTGIPVGRMVGDELGTVLRLGETLGRRVIGQQHGLDMIARRIQTARARLDNPDKPIGVFMLCGTSGVGKTETALALAEALYGGEHNLITINMSEFQEAHTVSTLKGAPPGYVGYGEGGILTEAVRRRPYSVVLLDEVEKAHPDVHELFFQVFDKGRMEDGEGRVIDFRNTIVLLTSNVGSEQVAGLCRDPASLPGPEALAEALQAPLAQVFPPALLGRLVTVPYYPLSGETMGRIVRLQLDRIRKRVAANHAIPFVYEASAVELIVRRCDRPEAGGRIIDAILTNTVLPRVSMEYLSRLARGEALAAITLGAADGEFTYAFA